MSLDLGVTVALFAFLVGVPLGLIFTQNITERYEKKISRAINGLIGTLEQPLRELRELPSIANKRDGQTQLPVDDSQALGDGEIIQDEQAQYRNHHQLLFFIDQRLLHMFNDYHDLKIIQAEFEDKINRLLISVMFFMIPGLLVQMGEIVPPLLSAGIFYILSLILFFAGRL
jgi:hypothetical protein